jgi:hypothetical protein
MLEYIGVVRAEKRGVVRKQFNAVIAIHAKEIFHLVQKGFWPSAKG